MYHHFTSRTASAPRKGHHTPPVGHTLCIFGVDVCTKLSQGLIQNTLHPQIGLHHAQSKPCHLLPYGYVPFFVLRKRRGKTASLSEKHNKGLTTKVGRDAMAAGEQPTRCNQENHHSIKIETTYSAMRVWSGSVRPYKYALIRNGGLSVMVPAKSCKNSLGISA